MIKESVFCPHCDYAVARFAREQMTFDMDCPRCERVKMSSFYSAGSRTHEKRRAKWERGEIKGAPPPLVES